jgi:Bax protein
MIVAQAILESGWGQSRFADEANNLFGIRTFDKSDNWMLPESKKDWTGWGVKVYSSKCASVRDYVRIINEVWAYEELRMARAENPNISAEELSIHLYRFSTNPKYTKLVINIIKTKLGQYDLS